MGQGNTNFKVVHRKESVFEGNSKGVIRNVIGRVYGEFLEPVVTGIKHWMVAMGFTLLICHMKWLDLIIFGYF